MHSDSPFNLDNVTGYQRWRSDKLARHPVVLEEILVPVANPFALTIDEKDTLLNAIRRCNMAIYRITGSDIDIADKNVLAEMGHQLGLLHLDNNLHADEDAISSLQVSEEAGKKAYIPYTNRPIAWHTDGYYNTGSEQIRAMLLHCVRPAEDGGSNQLLDHEMAYLMLRDENPDHIRALSKQDVMGIPENIHEGEKIRDAVSGPVFSLDRDGNLHMRYTARTRSISWSEDDDVQAAKAALERILKTPSPYHFEGTLQAGEGLLCNNVLHTRSKFNEGSSRLLYRARYFDRIANT
jgi:hypothetical protein